jgi:hypothetical protein
MSMPSPFAFQEVRSATLFETPSNRIAANALVATRLRCTRAWSAPKPTRFPMSVLPVTRLAPTHGDVEDPAGVAVGNEHAEVGAADGPVRESQDRGDALDAQLRRGGHLHLMALIDGPSLHATLHPQSVTQGIQTAIIDRAFADLAR